MKMTERQAELLWRVAVELRMTTHTEASSYEYDMRSLRGLAQRGLVELTRDAAGVHLTNAGLSAATGQNTAELYTRVKDNG